MPIIGLIENMSGFVCPHCNEMLYLFGSGGGEKTALAANVAFLGRIPFDSDMVRCGDSGTSFQKVYSDSLITKAFANIAKKISEKEA